MKLGRFFVTLLILCAFAFGAIALVMGLIIYFYPLTMQRMTRISNELAEREQETASEEKQNIKSEQ